MTEEQLYAQYLSETGQEQDPLYQQYLAETGQKGPAPDQKSLAGLNEQGSTIDAALQGFGSGGTFGYLPRAQAALEAAIDPNLTYEEALPHWQQREASLTKTNPVAFGAGSIAGSVMTPVPGTGAVKAGSVGGRILKAAAQGAAVSGAADTGFDIGSSDDLKSRLERAKYGGLTSGLFQGAGSTLNKLGEQLKSYGTLKLLGARGKDAEKLFERNKAGLKKTEEFLDRENLVGPLTTNADLAKRADKITQEAGKEIGETYKKVQAEGLDLLSNPSLHESPAGQELIKRAMETRLEPNKLADDFMIKAKEELSGTANGNQILSSLESQVENLRKVPPQKGIEGVVNFRKSLDDALRKSYEKPLADLGDKQEAMMTLRRYLKDATNDHIDALDKLTGSDASKKLMRLNDRFSNASTIKRIAGKSEMNNARNNLMGLPELMVGGAVGVGSAFGDKGEDATTSLGRAALAAGAYKLGRSYGPAMSYTAGRAIQKIPSIPTRPILTPWLTMTKESKNGR